MSRKLNSIVSSVVASTQKTRQNLIGIFREQSLGKIEQHSQYGNQFDKLQAYLSLSGTSDPMDETASIWNRCVPWREALLEFLQIGITSSEELVMRWHWEVRWSYMKRQKINERKNNGGHKADHRVSMGRWLS
jgi:hypothetical protein